MSETFSSDPSAQKTELSKIPPCPLQSEATVAESHDRGSLILVALLPSMEAPSLSEPCRAEAPEACCWRF